MQPRHECPSSILHYVLVYATTVRYASSVSSLIHDMPAFPCPFTLSSSLLYEENSQPDDLTLHLSRSHAFPFSPSKFIQLSSHSFTSAHQSTSLFFPFPSFSFFPSPVNYLIVFWGSTQEPLLHTPFVERSTLFRWTVEGVVSGL